MQSTFKNNKLAAFSSPLARSFIASGTSYCPALSHASASELFLCVINAFLVEIGLINSTNKVSASAPSKNSLSAFMDEEITDLLEIVRKRMKVEFFFL